MDRPAEAITANEEGSGPVFISYATADRKDALKFTKEIERRGTGCWISCRDVLPGQNYQEAIVNALREARAVLLIFSGAANSSDEIKKELSLASRYRVPVIALRIENVEPIDAFAYELSTRQWIDAFRGSGKILNVLVDRLADLARQETVEPGASPSITMSGRSTRRKILLASGCAVIATAGGLGLFELAKPRMPAKASGLVGDGEEALSGASIDQFAQAAESFRSAAAIAPGFAEPWGGLAYAYELQANLAPVAQARNLHARAQEASRRALALDPNNGNALAAVALAVPFFGNWIAAERVCRVGLEKAPYHFGMLTNLGFILAQVGRTSEALASIEMALRANPKFVTAHMFRVPLLDDLNRFDDAEAAVNEAARAWPRNYAIWFTKLYHLAFHDGAIQALAMIDDHVNRPLGIPAADYAVVRLRIQAIADRAKGEIDRAIAASFEWAPKGSGYAENGLTFAGAVGRVDDAFRFIEAYFFNRGFALPDQRFAEEQGTYTPPRKRYSGLLFERFMGAVQSDARFERLLSELGLTAYWKETRTRPDYLAWLHRG